MSTITVTTNPMTANTFEHPVKRFDSFEKELSTFINSFNAQTEIKDLIEKIKVIKKEIDEYKSSKEIIDKKIRKFSTCCGICNPKLRIAGQTIMSIAAGFFEVGALAYTTYGNETISKNTIFAFGVCAAVLDRILDVVDRIIWQGEDALDKLSNIISVDIERMRQYKKVIKRFKELMESNANLNFDDKVNETLEVYSSLPEHIKNANTPSEILSIALTKLPDNDEIKKTMTDIEENLPTNLTTVYLKDETQDKPTTTDKEKGHTDIISKSISEDNEKDRILKLVSKRCYERFKLQDIQYNIKTPKGKIISIQKIDLINNMTSNTLTEIVIKKD